MSIAPTLQSYLDGRAVEYTLVPHDHTLSSMDTAAAAHIPGDRLAKAVIVNRQGEHLMVVVPSDYHVHLGRLHRHLGAEVGLATEAELAGLFPDCERGAIPPVGGAYGITTLVENRLRDQPEIYFESGDHASLVRVSGDDFRALTADADPVDVAVHI